MLHSPEILKMLADTALGYSTVNTVMFIGLTVMFSLWGMLFFANGCAIYVHNVYDMDQADWYKKSVKVCQILLLAWSITYVIAAFFSSIGIVEAILTYLFAFICAMCVGIGTSLIYNIVWYVIISPYRCLRRKKRK
uniref:Transmembrane protein n=1 Tax=uncultured Alphaproteobacteria bacterium TaxID=91750 RepID=A0A6G8F309_9PROT|nr:hypothetical protein PlAlph_5390 [uncultured Alphaproteobacteria bacterium]